MPIGMRAHKTGQATHAIGEAADLRVDQPGSQAIPRLVIGERGIGETGAQAVVEPTVEIGKAGRHPHDPFVATLVRLDGWRQPGYRFRGNIRVWLRLRLWRWLLTRSTFRRRQTLRGPGRRVPGWLTL